MLKPYLVIVEKEGMYHFIRSSHDTFEEAHEEAKSALEYFADALVHVAEMRETGKIIQVVDFDTFSSIINTNRPTLNQVLGRRPKDARGCPFLWANDFITRGFKAPPDVVCSETSCIDCWNRPAERLES